MPPSMLARLAAILLVACCTTRAAEPAGPPGANQPQLGVAVAAYGSLVVMAVMPNGVAAAAGIRKDDIILTFNSRPITDGQQLVDAVNKVRVGSKIKIEVLRGPLKQTLTLQF